MFISTRLIEFEREKQLMVGHTLINDKALPDGVLARAGVALLLNDAEYWFWGVEDYEKAYKRHSKDKTTLLTVAAAFIAAEIDRDGLKEQPVVAYRDNKPIYGEDNHEI